MDGGNVSNANYCARKNLTTAVNLTEDDHKDEQFVPPSPFEIINIWFSPPQSGLKLFQQSAMRTPRSHSYIVALVENVLKNN